MIEFTQLLAKIGHTNFDANSFNYKSIKSENFDQIIECIIDKSKEKASPQNEMFEICQLIKKFHRKFPQVLDTKLNDDFNEIYDFDKLAEFGWKIKNLFNEQIIDSRLILIILKKLHDNKKFVPAVTLFIEVAKNLREAHESDYTIYMDIVHSITIFRKTVDFDVLKSLDNAMEELDKELLVVRSTVDIKPSLKLTVNNIIKGKTFPVSFNQL